MGLIGMGVSCKQERNMRNFTNRFENLATQRTLRCIWVPAHEGKSTPLVARWVETKEEAAERHEHDAVCAGEEGREPWPGMHLQAA